MAIVPAGTPAPLVTDSTQLLVTYRPSTADFRYLPPMTLTAMVDRLGSGKLGRDADIDGARPWAGHRQWVNALGAVLLAEIEALK